MPNNHSIDDALNILVLGETGVGKSTWINAFANYLRFKTLDDAQAGEPVCLIPTKFSLPDDNFEMRTIEFGVSENESFQDGQSATQKSLAHVFNAPEGKIRIIDTPGIGDVRGPHQDEINFENVLRYISRLPKLHGICILMKSNEARLTVSFRYCINELLTHLHRSAATNIIFCFTNARASFYKPGETLRTLKTFLEDLEKNHGVPIPTTNDTIFCLDNEAFRFLLASMNGFNFSEQDFEDYRQSWTRSQNITEAMVRRITRLNPHQLQDTVTINNARRIILALAKPLADITNNIQLNKKLLQDQQEDLKRHQGSYDDLMTKVKVTQVGIQTTPLGHPRTVCTSPECVDTVRIENTSANQTIYKSHCHPHCYLDGVEKDKVPNPDLQRCHAMHASGGRTCSECSCGWDRHMHIDYDQVQVSEQAEDPLVKDAIQKNLDDKTILETALKAAEAKQQQLEKEHKEILGSGAKFGAFLKAHAIKPYNDAIKEYLDYSIKEEERLLAAGKTNRFKLDTYKKNLQIYDQQKAILDNAIKSGAAVISVDEVMNIVNELKNLRINGKMFQKQFDASVIGEDKNFAYTENHYDPETGHFTNGQGPMSSNSQSSSNFIMNGLKSLKIVS